LGADGQPQHPARALVLDRVRSAKPLILPRSSLRSFLRHDLARFGRRRYALGGSSHGTDRIWRSERDLSELALSSDPSLPRFTDGIDALRSPGVALREAPLDLGRASPCMSLCGAYVGR